MAKNSPKTQVRPFLVRPGARYKCFGDGLCCTDIHVLGTLSRKELRLIRDADPDGARRDEDMDDEWVIRTAPDGGCHFLMPDMRCRIHAEEGPRAKPDFCRRFPVGLVATPAGGRVTTHHRCPCRTLGARPLLSDESVEDSLTDAKGRPRADRRVRKVPLTKKKKISFDQWRVHEAEILAALAEGAPPEEALDAEPFPKIKKPKWIDVAEEFTEAKDGTQFGFAIGWFGEAMAGLLDEEHRVRLPPRPWAAAFDRAEARSPDERSPEEMFADWIADEIWSLAWTEDRSFDVCRAELVTRLAVGRAIAASLESDHGLRPDRAAAEALLVIELVGDSEFWTDLLERIRV